MSLTSIRIRPYTEFLRTATGFDKLKILKQEFASDSEGKIWWVGSVWVIINVGRV